MKVLLLGGTAEARGLSHALDRAGFDLTVSLAGVTQAPARYGGRMRRGGFGGAEGLAAYLDAERIGVVVDATHPFAAHMSHNAAEAAAARGVPLLQLVRPPWPARPTWRAAETLADAARLIRPGARVFLATGAQSAAAFAARQDIVAHLRVIDRPQGAFPLAQGRWITARPPFTEAEERALFETYRIDTLVGRNSGGATGQEKFDGAQALGLDVIVVARPELPQADRAQTIEEAMAWLTLRR